MSSAIPTDVLLDAWYTVHEDQGFVFPRLAFEATNPLEVQMYRFLQEAIAQTAATEGCEYVTWHTYPPYVVAINFTQRVPVGVCVRLLGDSIGNR